MFMIIYGSVLFALGMLAGMYIEHRAFYKIMNKEVLKKLKGKSIISGDIKPFEEDNNDMPDKVDA